MFVQNTESNTIDSGCDMTESERTSVLLTVDLMKLRTRCG